MGDRVSVSLSSATSVSLGVTMPNAGVQRKAAAGRTNIKSRDKDTSLTAK